MAPTSERETLFQVFFYGVFLVLLYELARLARPFLPALMGAAGLSLAFYPLHLRLTRRFGFRPGAGAFLSTLLVLLMIVVPFGLAAGALVKEAAVLTATARRIVATLNELDQRTVLAELPDRVRPLAQSLVDFFATLDVDLGGLLVLGASRVGEAFLEFGGQAARNVLFIFFNFALTALTLFYAFRDGPSFLRWALRLIPMPAAHKQAVAGRVYDTFRAVVVGSLLTALLQGLVASAGFALVGMRLPWLLGLATTAFAIFPSAQLVILPVTAYTLSYDLPRGLALGVCVLAIQSLEHLVKPVLIGSKARLPAILLFFAMFGALFAYGFFGLILGPLLVTAVLAFVEIYRTEYYRPPSEGSA